MKWFRCKANFESVPELIPDSKPRELTGIEKMEIEWRLAERKATELRDAKLRQIISAKRAAIQPQLDEIQRLEQELSPRAWVFQNAYGQQQNIRMGPGLWPPSLLGAQNLSTGLEQSNFLWGGLLGNAIGGGKA